VNAYFQSISKYWKNVYSRDSVDGEIYRVRQSTALDWIDDLALVSGSRVLEIGSL
jgi:hypothetical protein